MIQNKIACLFVLLSFLLPASLSAEPPRENLWSTCVEPNRELQDLLHCLAALRDRHLPQSRRDDAMAVVRSWEEHCENKYIGLEAVAGGRKELVLQFLYFDDSAKGHYEATAVLGWLRARDMRLPDILAATAQFFDAEDAQVREKVEEFLLCAEYPAQSTSFEAREAQTPDFTVLADVFRRQREAAPPGLEPLARHMFAKDPEQALRRLADVYLDAARRDELLALLDATKAGNGTELLRKLVAPEHWWAEKWFVQLYAAEKTCSNDDLADEEVLKQLNATEHLIVWQRLKRAEADDKAPQQPTAGE